MSNVIMFPNSKLYANDNLSGANYVSPYLLKPLRSYKQAYEDINELKVLNVAAAMINLLHKEK